MGFSALSTALEQIDFIALAPVLHPLLHSVSFRHDPLKHRASGCDLLVGHHVPVGIEHRDFRPTDTFVVRDGKIVSQSFAAKITPEPTIMIPLLTGSNVLKSANPLTPGQHLTSSADQSYGRNL